MFLVSAVTPIAFGNNIRIIDNESIVEIFNYNSYHVTEITSYAPHIPHEYIKNNDTSKPNQVNILKETLKPLNSPMDSPWPMYCHDVCHTGRSSYSTVDNIGFEKWRFRTNGWAGGSPVIDGNGIIYIGATNLYAIYPNNGTLKWKYPESLKIESAPAIDENGVLYVGTKWAYPSNYMYAIYSNNGTLKWKYGIGADDIYSSPVIGDDGSIYFGCGDDYIYALYPNGTLKWRYQTNHVVYSSPGIGNDGTIYCGSHDTYLYALYPNNGTLKWAYGTGNWIRTSPCIADDGTVYVVSLDNHLHAVNPDGTLKWKTNVGAGTSPTIGQDGTIYCGYDKLKAVYPNNGTVKWSFNPGPDRGIRGATPCNSIDGTIYFGTHIGETDGGELIAVNPDGTEKWRKMIADTWVDSAPAIGEDGTVYIGSTWAPSDGWLHAFGPLDPDAPSAPDINGPSNGNAGTEYDYTFTSTSPLGNDAYYYIAWGDGAIEEWVGPYTSGQNVTLSHTWSYRGTYTIKAHAKDTDNLLGPWSSFEVTITRNRAVYSNTLLLRLLEQFPLLQRLFKL